MQYRQQIRMPPPQMMQGSANTPNNNLNVSAGPSGLNGMPGSGVQMGMQMQMPMQMMGEVGFDGKMLRKAMARKTVDYNPSVVNYLEVSFV